MNLQMVIDYIKAFVRLLDDKDERQTQTYYVK